MPIPDRLNPAFASSLPAAQVRPDPMEEARRRLIVALDVPDANAAIHLVNQLESRCQWFKVGLELFVAAGPPVLEPLIARGHSIFLDLKFHDIPNTVAGAVRSAAALGVRMVNVHAAGGPAMLEAARGALEGFAEPAGAAGSDGADQYGPGAGKRGRRGADARRTGGAAGADGSGRGHPWICVLSRGGCPPARADRSWGGAGDSWDSPRGGRCRRSEAVATPAEALRAGRQLPGGWAGRLPMRRTRRMRRRNSGRDERAERRAFSEVVLSEILRTSPDAIGPELLAVGQQT